MPTYENHPPLRSPFLGDTVLCITILMDQEEGQIKWKLMCINCKQKSWIWQKIQASVESCEGPGRITRWLLLDQSQTGHQGEGEVEDKTLRSSKESCIWISKGDGRPLGETDEDLRQFCRNDPFAVTLRESNDTSNHHEAFCVVLMHLSV